MTQQIINIGTAPNDGNGDQLRIAMAKVNQNFSEVYLQIAEIGSGPGITPVDGNITLTPGPTGSIIVNANTSADGFRITQIGTGNAFVVEDSASSDTTPFIITSIGSVGIGLVPTEKLHVGGNMIVVGDVYADTLTSSTADGTAPLRITSTTVVNNLTAQYSTSIVSGTSNVKVVADQVLVSTGGNVNVLAVSPSTVTVTGDAVITGTATIGNLSLVGAVTVNELAAGTSNVKITTNSNVSVSVGGVANVLAVANTGATVTGFLTVTGNVNVPNIGVSGTLISPSMVNGNSNVRIAANANVTISAIGVSNVVVVTGTGANIAGTATITGNLSAGNISTVGTITTSTVLNGTSNVRIIQNDNVLISSGGVANVVTITTTGANIAGTANITGAVAIGGNANVGNLGTVGQIISTLADGTSPFTVTSTTRVANLNVATAGSLINGNSNVVVTANANVTISSVGNANVVTVTGSGIVVAGSLNRGAPVTKTGDFSVGVTENWLILNGAGVITVTLPSAATFIGREITFKTIAAQFVNSNATNVVPSTSAVAGTSILNNTAGSWATLVSDGTNWITMARG